jgi:hypothetical protein
MTDVERIDDYLGECCRDNKVLASWQTLKSAVLTQQTTNTGSPKLPTRADFIEWLSTFESAPSACSIYDWMCRQLRASA